MRIECPSCAAIYDLPERLLSGGSRVLRCAACGKTWSVNPSAPQDSPPADDAPPAEDATPVVQAPPPKSSDHNFAALMEAVVAANRDDEAEEPKADTAATLEHEPDPHAAHAELVKAATVEPDATPGIPPAVIVARPSAAPMRPSFGLIMAWVATLGGLGALILALALFPQGVVAHWPAAARLYEAVGITFGAS